MLWKISPFSNISFLHHHINIKKYIFSFCSHVWYHFFHVGLFVFQSLMLLIFAFVSLYCLYDLTHLYQRSLAVSALKHEDISKWAMWEWTESCWDTNDNSLDLVCRPWRHAGKVGRNEVSQENLISPWRSYWVTCR